MKKIDTFYLTEQQIEELKRKKSFNKKMAKASKYILIGLAGLITSIILQGKIGDIMNISENARTLLESSSALLGSGGVIIGGMKFAKSLHEPLTEKEAEEFAEKDAEEKKGGIRNL